VSEILDPLYLNERMLLNLGAYLFDGYALEKDEENQNAKSGQVKGRLGLEVLKGLISGPEFEAGGNVENSKVQRSRRMYTLGSLHMKVLDELGKRKEISSSLLRAENSSFVSGNVILKPIDFVQILEVLELSGPAIMSGVEQFFPHILAKYRLTGEDFQSMKLLVSDILASLREDYLSGKNLEFIMLDPQTLSSVGILDVDVSSLDPREIQAKLNDGQFKVYGKLLRKVDSGDQISTFQRTTLSKIWEIISQISQETDENAFESSMLPIKAVLEKYVQMDVKGPASRVLALSVCL